ncbi:MAG: pyruvate formate lyase family protein, partial [Gammaproteobacteria bacterium]|nr:pyruvate formate lyase family protein [Gammaproteobacteria bacterium]
SSDDREALKETCLYFLDKSQERLIKQVQQSAVGDWFDIIHENRGLFPFETIQGANLQPDWGMLLSKGLRGIIDEIQARLRRFSDLLEDDPQKMWFWQAAIITCEATIHFAHRYARLASDLAAGEKDPQRRTELERIADICMHVPEHPARTFHEALQSIRIFTVACQLEHNMRTSAMPGRVDQYLYPYFKKDLEEGRLDMEGAAELLGEYIAHLGGQEKMVVAFRQQMDQGQHITNITIGGVTSEGKDASNELSYLILHAAGLGRYAEPHITLRWHAGTPRWLMLKAVETNQKIGGGIPQFMSDPHIIQYMLDRGVKREHALDYAIIGCVASCPGGNSDRGMYRVAAIINAALSVDLALHSGISPLTGNRIGPETGDPRTFSSFDQLLAAYKIQHKFIIQRSLWKARIAHKTQQELFRSILPSALMPRCLERGRTYQLVAYP